MKKIIVTITSWPKRIKYVEYVIFNMLKCQTMKADKIILNLSTDEFPNKEKDLPENLLLIKKHFDEFEINWVKENTRAFKRLLPTLEKYFNEDCWILTVDDDYFYKKDYIEFMVNTAEKYYPYCITPSKTCVHGYSMIFSPEFFRNGSIFNITPEEMEEILASDSWADAAILSNGIEFLNVSEIKKHYKETPRPHTLRSLYGITGQRQKRRKFIKEKFLKMGYDLKNYPM